jgi:hypothetical protein
MNDAGLRDDITHLEDRIEALRVSIERCRKISVAAKIAIAGGLIWMLLALIALAPSTPVSFFTGLAAVLGGIVLLGSNKTTWEQTEAALQQAQLMRSQLIGNIPLRLVADEKPTLH